MNLNKIYKEVEDEKENEVDDTEGGVIISREDFIAEHKNLIKVLRSGDKKALEAEALKQEQELSEELDNDVEED